MDQQKTQGQRQGEQPKGQGPTGQQDKQAGQHNWNQNQNQNQNPTNPQTTNPTRRPCRQDEQPLGLAVARDQP